MSDLVQVVQDTGEGFVDSFSDQLGFDQKSGDTTSGVASFTGFWDDFLGQLSGGKSEDQMRHAAESAKHAEGGHTPQEISAIRHRLQELNAPSSAPSVKHEYRGPEVPSQAQQSGQTQTRGPEVPPAQTPSSLTFAKQGTNENLVKMTG